VDDPAQIPLIETPDFRQKQKLFLASCRSFMIWVMNASEEVTFLLARRKLRDCDPEQIRDPDSFIPRIARQMALAIRLEGLIKDETYGYWFFEAVVSRIGTGSAPEPSH